MNTPERDSSRDYPAAVPSLLDIFWGKLATSRRRIAEWRRQGFLNKEKFSQTRHRAMRFEALEPRLLLSADLTHSAAAGEALDATLKVEEFEGAAILRLVDNLSSNILSELLIDRDIEVDVRGHDLHDKLKIGFDRALLAHKIRFSFHGEGGFDELSGADLGNTWLIDALGAGSTEDGAFTGVEAVKGGAAEDAFVVRDSAATTALDGGSGNDSLVGADAQNTWTVTANDSGALNAQAFAGVENLRGGAGDDTFTFTAGAQVSGGISGGAGSDTLVAADADNTWVLSAADAGSLNEQSFSEIENLTGGAANDTFIFAGGSISGTIDGGAGINTFDYSSRTDRVTLNLQSGAATDVVALVNVTRMIGGSGDDILIGRDEDSTWTVTGANAGHVAGFEFEQIENLSGGAASDRFVFTSQGSLSGLVAGGLGIDEVAAANGPNRWVIDASDAGTLNDQGFVEIENLTGGDDSDAFELLAPGALSGTAAGGLGADRFRGPERKTVWRFTGNGAGNAGGTRFSGMEAVDGGGGQDSFAIEDGADFAGSLDGGGGTDDLDYSAASSTVTVDLAAGTATALLGFSNVEAVKGGTAVDTLKGPSQDATWRLNGPDAGDVSGVLSFSGFENLEGAAGNADTFVFGAAGALAGSVAGGDGGFDSIVLDGGSFDEVSYLSTSPDSGTITRDASVVVYRGMEPIQDVTVVGTLRLRVADPGPHTLTLSDDAGPNDAGESRFTSPSSETIDFANPTNALIVDGSGGVDTVNIDALDAAFAASLTVNAGAGADVIHVNAVTGTGSYTVNGDAGADAVHVGNIGTSSELTAAGGTGNDTYYFGDAWGQVTINEGAESGSVDKLDFSAYTGTIRFAFPGAGAIELIGSDGSKVILSSASVGNIENIIGANIDLTGSLASVKTELVGGLRKLVDFTRDLADVGQFATALPLIGKNAEVTIGKALGFAEALDEIRFQVEEFFDDLSSLTTKDLIDFLEAKFTAGGSAYVGALKHLGAAILAGKPILDTDIEAADIYDFKLTVNGVEYHAVIDVDRVGAVSVTGNTATFGLGAGPYTVANLLGAVNAALVELDDIAGQIVVQARDGRVAFQSVSTEIDSFSVTAGALGTAVASKLGIPTSLSDAFSLTGVQDMLLGLDDLELSIPGVTLGVTFEGGLPKLRFGVDYSAERTSKFLYDFGPEAESLGIAIGVQAQIEAKAELAADLELGLTLQNATTVDFFLDVDELRAGVTTTGTAAAGVDLNLGFLGLTTDAGSTLTLDAGLALNATSIAALQNVTDPASINIGSLSFTPTGGDGTGSQSFNLHLQLSVDTGTDDIGFTASGTLDASGNPFDGSDIDLQVGSDFDANFPDFNNLSAQGVITAVNQVAAWLNSLRSSELLSSIDLPFIEQGLDTILALGEVVSDALLYDDGADDEKDGANKLVTDLNAALADARLGSLLRFVGDGTDISLRVIDPSVDAFSIEVDAAKDLGGYTQLGFGGGVTNASGTPLSISGIDPTGAAGVISQDAAFSISVTRNGGSPETFKVFLDKDDTSGNIGVGDDVAKLLDADNAPTFSNAQEFAARLLEILPLPGGVEYDPVKRILTYDIQFEDVQLFEVELPLDFELDLAPIGEVSSNTRLIIGASGGLAFTLGFDLSESPPTSSLLDLTDTFEQLGVTVKKEEAGSADSAPRTIVGQLSGDAHFTVSYNPSALVTVPMLSGRPGTDVNVTRLDGPQDEATIAVNPKNPLNIVVGVNDGNPVDGIRGATTSGNHNDSVWVTKDGGVIWTKKTIPVPGGTAFGGGDPSLTFSRDGSRIVYTHLINRIDGLRTVASAVSSDGGDTWQTGTLADLNGLVDDVSLGRDEDLDGSNDDNDKNFVAVGPEFGDPDSDQYLVTWHRDGVIYASTSFDGLAWTTPQLIGGLTFGNSTVGPQGQSFEPIPYFGTDGQMYVVWHEYGFDGKAEIKFDVSLDGGITWVGGSDTVFFDTNLFNLEQEDKDVLDAVAAKLIADPLLVATIVGYTDTQGDAGPNQTLSVNRAQAVFNYLRGIDPTSPHNIAESRLSGLGLGETHLAFPTPNNTPEDANRRVEITYDRVLYTDNVNPFRDPFRNGVGYDGSDDTNGSGAGDGLGEYEIPAQPNRGLRAGLSMAVDRSGGAHDGWIYVTFTDQGDLDHLPDSAFPADEADHNDTDIFLIASDDGGLTWDALGASPKKINKDTGDASQFFSWVGVDQTTGNVAVSWYDARNDDGVPTPGADTDTTVNNEVQYFASYSLDGGLTWSKDLQVSDGTSMASAAGTFNFGDYTGLAFSENVIHFTWSDNSNSTSDNPDGFMDAYYDRIRLTNTTITDLLDDINAAIADQPVLQGKFQAQAEGNLVKLVALDPSIDSFTVSVANNADPAFRDLGFQLSKIASEGSSGQLEVKAAKNAPTFVGQLTRDATFNLNFAGGSTTAVTVEQADTVSSFAPNRNILDLVFDVQAAVDEALVGGSATSGTTGTTLVQSGQTFQTRAADGAIRVGDIIVNLTTGAVGAIASIDSQTQISTSALTGGAGGDNTWDAGDQFRINPVEVGTEAGRLLFTRIGATTFGASDNFTITPRTPGSAAELGITRTLNSDEADLLIVRSDGVTSHRVVLDQVTTIQGLIDAIAAQTSGAIVASLTKDDPTGEATAVNEAKTGITIEESSNPGVFSTATSAGTSTTLSDSTKNFLTNGLAKAGDTIYNLTDGSRATIVALGNGLLTTTPLVGGTDNSWASGDKYSLGKFKVGMTNASVAAIQLGIVGTDTDPQDDQDAPDGKVLGATIAGATLLDRFFISAPGADTNADITNDPGLLNKIINARLTIRAGTLLSDIKITEISGGKTTISAEGFDFSDLDANNDHLPDSTITIEIRDVAGFAPGVYTITDILDQATVRLSSAAVGVDEQQGGAGILNTGVDASAVFGFIEIGLDGTADLGAELSWGFNTASGTPGADGRLTAQEVIDNLDQPLSLMLLPDLTPIALAGATTAAGTATSLTHTGAQFKSTKRVRVGDVVRNTTQDKTATITAIVDDNTLNMTALSGGGTWADGDEYEIVIRNFGVVDAEVSLDLAGGLSGLASAVGIENPELALRILALGDPFLGTRFEQANYSKFSDTQFDVDGDFRAKLLPGLGATGTATSGDTTTFTKTGATFKADGVKAGDYIRNTTEGKLVKVTEVVSETELKTEAVGGWSGDAYAFIDPVTLRFGSDDVLVIDAQFSAGKTRVTIVPVEGSFDLPEASELDSVILLPEVEVDMSDLGDILPDFQNFGLAEIIALLQALSDYLGQFESFGFLNEPIPLINTSVNDLLGFADDFATALQEFQANPAGSLQLLEDKLLESLGIDNNSLTDIVDFINDGSGAPALTVPTQVIELDFDLPSGMLKFDIAWGTSFSEGLDVALPGLDFGDALSALGLGSVLDLAGSANLQAEGTVLARMTLGVKVDDFDLDDGLSLDDLLDHLFLFDTTGLEARLRVAGEDISFRVGVGPFSLTIGSTDPDGPNPQVAEIELDGSFGLALSEDLFDPDVDPDGDEHAVSFNQVLDNLSFDIVETDIEGTISGYLPVFFPNESRFIGAIKIGGTDGDKDFTATGDLVSLVETLIDDGQLNFELISEDADSGATGVQGTKANAVAIDVTDVIEGITSFDLTKLSVFDNILLAVDGLDLVLEMIQDVFEGTDITLPLIGDDLNKAAGFIGDVRDDLIDPLRDLMETAKDAALDFADPNKNVISKAIFDILGPNGANILRARDGFTGTPSAVGDYIGLLTNLDQFLFPDPALPSVDRDEVFIEWDLNLGSTLVNAPLDIGFDLGIPGLGLETEGDLNILIDWALDLGFGLDFNDGFYLKTEDADELLFNAEVTLPDAAITGTLGFLALTGENTTLDFGEFGDKTTTLGATFKVDISNVIDQGDVASATGNTLTMSKSFGTNALVGKLVKIVDGNGDDQTRRITANAGNSLTIEGAWAVGRTPDSDGEFQILDPNMGFTEFGNIDFDARIAAEASAALDLTLGLSDDLVGGDVAAGFPSVEAEFRFLWQLGNRATTGGDTAQEIADNAATRFRSFASLGDEGFGAIEHGLKYVSIENINLDLGSFISDVLGPIVEEVSKFTEPMQPIIDFVTSPVPIIGQLGLDITWLDLAEMLAGDKVNIALIRSITEIVSFVNQIAELSESDAILLPIGDFVIFDDTDGGSGFTPSLWDGGFDLNSEVNLDDPGSLGGIIGDIFGTGGGLGDLTETISEVLGGLGGGSGSGDSADVLQGLTSGQSAGGFSFPFLEDPSQIFGLIMGNNIDLVAYDLGALEFGFEFNQFFSIFGPLGVSIGLLVEIMIDTAFVYDTQGIRDFVESDFRNPLLLFNGFAIAADPKLDGVDDPEMRFFAELQAAAELNLGIARAGVAAAFGFEMLFNLFDPDEDGRIRITELVGNIANQLRAPSDAEKLLAPLAIFDVSGEIFARLFAFLKIDFGFFEFEKEFPIFGPETLLSFDIDFFRPPILASELDNGDLLIHAGEFADQRLLGEATDLSEHILITKTGGSGNTITVEISSTGATHGGDSLGDDSEVPLGYEMKKGGKIIFDGGKGNDRLQAAGFSLGDVLFDIDLGVGDDEVLLSGGITDKFSTIAGGKGKDEITGTAGSDLITGDSGDDIINAGDGDDLVFGDEGGIGSPATGLAKATDGVDIIDGQGGSDIVFGGGKRDTLKGGSSVHADLLIGGEGVVTFLPGAFPKFANVLDLLQGGIDEVENLLLDASAGDIFDGGGGVNIIMGTAGPDVLTGGDMADIIIGLGGADTIDGKGGNDILFGDGAAFKLGAGGSGAATGDSNTLTDATADFSLVKVGDYVFNLSEDTFVRVTAINSITSVETEAVASWSGDSYKFFVPTPVAGTGDAPDRIQGGTGDDLIFGGGGNDFLAGDAISAGLPATGGDDHIFGGSGADRMFGDNVQVDMNGKTALVPVVSGNGDDRMFGQGEADAMYGGGGFDYMDGGAGSDRLFGGDDSDTLIFNKGSDRLDGEEGGDGYFAIMQGGNAESLVIAQDTGTSGADLLAVSGTVFDDQFLLRANTAGTDAFIAMIKEDFFVERINYGGSSSASCQRQLRRRPLRRRRYRRRNHHQRRVWRRHLPGRPALPLAAHRRRKPTSRSIRSMTMFATIETTRGFLSNGISEPMTINGGAGRTTASSCSTTRPCCS